MKKIDYEHFGRFVYPINIGLHKDNLYFNIVKADFDENDYVSDLYTLKNKKVKRLTNTGNVRSYYFVDDDIIFPSLRNPKDKEAVKNGAKLTVLQKLSLDGGEAEEFLRLDYLAGRFVFLNQNKFYFTAQYSAEYADALAKAKGDAKKACEIIKENSDYIVLDEAPFWQNGAGVSNKIRNRLYFYDNGKITPLVDEFTNVSYLNLSPNNKKLYYIAERYVTGVTFMNNVYEIDVKTNKQTDISFSNKTDHSRIFPLPDGKIVLFANTLDAHGINENDKIFVKNADETQYKLIYDDGMRGFSNSVNTDIKMERTLTAETVYHDGKLFVIDTVNDSSHIIGIDVNTSEIQQMTQMRGMINEFIANGNDFYAIAMRKGGCEIYQINEFEEKQLTKLNEANVTKYEYSEPIDCEFVNENGVTIHGFVIKPTEYTEGKKYPTVLDIHGGPKTAYGNVYFHEMQLWANRGMAVIFCNPTGSDGRGDEFADIRGHYGETDYRDIMKFVDVVTKKFDFIDKNKLGVTGGSYGGYMTNWIIGHTDKFVAAASQRSISNWTTFNTMSDIGAYFGNDQTNATIWSDFDSIWRQSPLKYADKVKTPTLFIHSDADYRCPLTEGLQMFHAIRDHGVDTRLCMFKGENHELSRSGKPKHRVRRLREITEWLEKYLKV
ncbi:MAG TPA: S9 family peptidase [Clostridia bacterium]|nr:S9 family peptidase [Clostridia bacterium]